MEHICVFHCSVIIFPFVINKYYVGRYFETRQIQLALHTHRLYTHRFNQPLIKNICGKNFQKVPKKQNLYLLYVGNYLHSIYIEFTTLYIVLGIISNLEMI